MDRGFLTTSRQYHTIRCKAVCLIEVDDVTGQFYRFRNSVCEKNETIKLNITRKHMHKHYGTL